MKYKWAIPAYLALLLWLFSEEYKSAANKPDVLRVAILVFVLHALGLWLTILWRKDNHQG